MPLLFPPPPSPAGSLSSGTCRLLMLAPRSPEPNQNATSSSRSPLPGHRFLDRASLIPRFGLDGDRRQLPARRANLHGYGRGMADPCTADASRHAWHPVRRRLRTLNAVFSTNRVCICICIYPRQILCQTLCKRQAPFVTENRVIGGMERGGSDYCDDR